MRISDLLRAACTALITGACCLLAAGCSGSSSKSNKESDPPPKSIKNSFDQVQTGMSDKEVIDLLGASASSAEVDAMNTKDMLPKGFDLPGLPGVAMPKIGVKRWEEGDMVYEVVFRDGKVMSKSSGSKQQMAAGKPAKTTKENADKVKVGMTKAEVEALLGPGITRAGAKIDSFGGEVMVWEGEAGTITVGFETGKVAVAAAWQPKK
jgi:outer membrane protein assembly factor BamE (lipoprotein component of BamABCDE complex)